MAWSEKPTQSRVLRVGRSFHTEPRKARTDSRPAGFDVSYRPRFPIVGSNGGDLAEKWKIWAESYLGPAVPGFPSFLTFIGPTWPIENGSVMGPLGSVADYALQINRKMQGEAIHTLAPKQGVTDLFNAHCQDFITRTVWTEDCRSSYKDNDTGRVNAIWPGSSLHYTEVIRTPRFEDYDITYRYANPWPIWAWALRLRIAPRAPMSVRI